MRNPYLKWYLSIVSFKLFGRSTPILVLHFGCPHFTVPVVAVVLIICVEQVEDVEKAAADATGDGEEQHDLVSCLLEDQLDWAPGDEVEQTKDSPKGSHGCFGKKKGPL